MTSSNTPEPVDQDIALRTSVVEAQTAEAFKELHRNTNEDVIAYLKFVRGATLDDAKDAAQNAFKHAWQLMHDPQKWERIDDPALWIRGVAWNMLRTPPGPRHRPAVPIEQAVEVPDRRADPGEVAALRVSVMAALDKLDPDIRDVMLLKSRKFRLEEIVSHMKATGRPMDEAAVRTLLRKGRDALRPLLQESVQREGVRS